MPTTKKSPKQYFGVTSAYQRFRRNSLRTHDLLEAGLSGLGNKRKELDEIVKKFGDLKQPGRHKNTYTPLVSSRRLEDGNVELEMDIRSARFLKHAIERAAATLETLRFHLYSVLAVAIWGAFETYIVMLLEELYRKRPEILTSSELVTVQEVLENRSDLITFLIERQLAIIGHWALGDVLQYLEKRVSFRPSDTLNRKLRHYYSVRNVFAHNSGMVRPSFKSQVPQSLTIVDGELRVTRAFLLTMLRDIQRMITSIERHVERKFYEPKGAHS